ncbi:hypothetical protein EDB19DRAFT_1684307 [Suillus lakei]|nr:hypothetical protein EDB19DRAFT_1684307 [Suillus lakei]
MWYQQHTIAWVIIATTVFGFLFYSLTIMASLISPACPFQTPISTMLRMLRNRILRPVFKSTYMHLQQLTTSVHNVLQRLLGTLRSSWTQFSQADPVRAVGAFVGRCCQPLFHALYNWLQSSVLHSSTKVVDSEAPLLDQILDVVSEDKLTLNMDLKDAPHRPSRSTQHQVTARDIYGS